MTTPDRLGAPEDLGILELFGNVADPFTRAVRLGLAELSIPVMLIERAAHSVDIKAHNAYGLLPVLVHRPDGLYTQESDIVSLSEASAIRRYIDEFLHPQVHSRSQPLTPPLNTQAGFNDPKTVLARATLDGCVVSFSQTLLPAVEHGFVKPAAQMKKNGADDESIRIALQAGLERTHSLLEIVEAQLHTATWVMGDHLSWADLFLFPIIHDLARSPANHLVAGDSPACPRIAAWFQAMLKRPSVASTTS